MNPRKTWRVWGSVISKTSVCKWTPTWIKWIDTARRSGLTGPERVIPSSIRSRLRSVRLSYARGERRKRHTGESRGPPGNDSVCHGHAPVMRQLTKSAAYGLTDVSGEYVRGRFFADLVIDGFPAGCVQLLHLILHALGDEFLVHTRDRL